ncbi:GDP-mannose 4,6-dehydratase [bacterium]|nr:GDP-mannose 4,6-dehydratase [bacterium]
MKKALIFGAAGQDGSYLTDYLLAMNYAVHCSCNSLSGSDILKSYGSDPSLVPQVSHSIGNVGNGIYVNKLISSFSPDEIYYLPSVHEVDLSVSGYIKSRTVTLDGLIHVLSASLAQARHPRIFFASSSNIFKNSKETPQNEQTRPCPDSVYGHLKLSAMGLIDLYRREGLFSCSGVLYNHESARRNEFFLPQKIATSAAEIKLGLRDSLVLGGLTAKRDWGDARDFVRAMWLALQGNEPRDYVIGTGMLTSVEDVLDIVFDSMGLNWKLYIEISRDLLRQEKTTLVADARLIEAELGWKPRIHFHDTLREMADAALRRIKDGN